VVEVTFDRQVDFFRMQARACEHLGSPLYAVLVDRIADDIEAGGLTCGVLEGHADDPGPSALALRLLGAVHYVVLSGAAPDLAACYPSAGGRADPDAAWSALRRLLVTHRSTLLPLLERAPQTNEVGRSTALVGGLLHVADTFGLPVRLYEIGCSAGLNLRPDRYRYLASEASWGPADSPVTLADAWRGPLPPLDAGLEIVARMGSDLAPIDPSTDDGRLRLLSYVWPDQVARLDRIRGALEVAGRYPVEIRREDAVSTVRRLEPAAGHTTVLWHSVMWQYLTRDDRAAVGGQLDRLAASASRDAPFAHVFVEPTRRAPETEHEFLVVLETWPGERRILGTAAPHGLPTTWE
jgi:hypothetical protein